MKNRQYWKGRNVTELERSERIKKLVLMGIVIMVSIIGIAFTIMMIL